MCSLDRRSHWKALSQGLVYSPALSTPPCPEGTGPGDQVCVCVGEAPRAQDENPRAVASRRARAQGGIAVAIVMAAGRAGALGVPHSPGLHHPFLQGQAPRGRMCLPKSRLHWPGAGGLAPEGVYPRSHEVLQAHPPTHTCSQVQPVPREIYQGPGRQWFSSGGSHHPRVPGIAWRCPWVAQVGS